MEITWATLQFAILRCLGSWFSRLQSYLWPHISTTKYSLEARVLSLAGLSLLWRLAQSSPSPDCTCHLSKPGSSYFPTSSKVGQKVPPIPVLSPGS